MTTQSWSTPVEHSSDATFRAWGSELQAKFLAAGLVQTADTGQINWSTVTRAGTSADAGYEIYYLNDSLFATAPIYIKVRYGTSGVATQPRITIQTGTGTNSTGTITGTVSGTLTVTSGNSPLSTTISYQSFLCVTAGFVGLIWKANGGASALAMGGFCICRTCDSTGAISATGAFLYSSATGVGSATTNQSLRFAATAVAYASTTSPAALIPGAQTSSTIGTDTQAFLFWMITPQVAPVFGICVVFVSEIGEGSTFTATLIGTTSHTYIQTGRQIGQGWTAASPSSQGLCMLWE